MNNILRQAGLLASAAFVLTAAGSALAAEPHRMGGEQVVVSGNDVGRPMPMRKHWDPAARADHMRTMLQLRPEQEPALKAFLDATRPPERRMEMKHGEPPAPPKTLTTPERLDREAKRMAEHQAAFQKRAAATRAFYGQLSPSQQKVFDTLRVGHGGGRHMRIIRRGGPGGPVGGPMGGPGEGRMMMRRVGPDGAPPAPGGMAWNSDEGEDFAMLDDDDMDIGLFIDDEQTVGDDD